MKSFALVLALLAVGCGAGSGPPSDAGTDTAVDAGSDAARDAGSDASSDAGSDATSDGAACATGLADCGGSCVDLMTDDANCGACGLVCGDSTCVAGVCDSSCPTDTTVCGVRCCPATLGCDASGSACATPAPACPVDPPTDGAACTAPMTCDWLRCATTGHASATCDGSMWTVTTEACASFLCEGGSSGSMCMANQICRQNIGGAFIADCQANPCGDMPLEKSCACTGCAPENCTITGRTVSCNTCPSGLCP